MPLVHRAVLGHDSHFELATILLTTRRYSTHVSLRFSALSWIAHCIVLFSDMKTAQNRQAEWELLISYLAQLYDSILGDRAAKQGILKSAERKIIKLIWTKAVTPAEIVTALVTNGDDKVGSLLGFIAGEGSRVVTLSKSEQVRSYCACCR
jgi:hypothetical protein